MKTFNTIGNANSYDIVHILSNKDNYTIINNNGEVTFTSPSLDVTYTVSNVEETRFRYKDSSLVDKFPFSDFINSWNKIITPDSTIESLRAFGDTTEIESTFYKDATYGIGWGTNDNNFKSFIIDPNLNFNEIYIQYSGFYNQPSGGLGYLKITDINDNKLLSLTDAWTMDSEGQTLNINGTTIFSNSTTNIIDREDTVIGKATKISMTGYTSDYPYTKRYIKNLWIR